MQGLPEDLLERHPILKYRVKNYLGGKSIRGMGEHDCHKCKLVLDDMAIAGDYHFPCIIYLRQHGGAIGKVSGRMREERLKWYEGHDCYNDSICRENCLDVCVDFNNKAEEL